MITAPDAADGRAPEAEGERALEAGGRASAGGGRASRQAGRGAETDEPQPDEPAAIPGRATLRAGFDGG